MEPSTTTPEIPTARIRTWDRIAWIITAAVFLLVSLMRRPEKFNLGINFQFLPPIYSAINALVAVSLVLALLKIKSGDIAGHKRYINLALTGSGLFLSGYVIYHFTSPETPYGGQGLMKGLYLFLLITHIALATLTLPFILLAYIRGYFGALMAHRKLVKWIWPLWFYVAATGPICYLMLRPYFKG